MTPASSAPLALMIALLAIWMLPTVGLLPRYFAVGTALISSLRQQNSKPALSIFQTLCFSTTSDSCTDKDTYLYCFYPACKRGAPKGRAACKPEDVTHHGRGALLLGSTQQHTLSSELVFFTHSQLCTMPSRTLRLPDAATRAHSLQPSPKRPRLALLARAEAANGSSLRNDLRKASSAYGLVGYSGPRAAGAGASVRSASSNLIVTPTPLPPNHRLNPKP